MAPMKTFEFIVIKITLYPDLLPQYPRYFVMYRGQGVQARIPQYPSLHLQQWFAEALRREKAVVPAGCDFKFTEWLLHSSRKDYFIVNQTLYDNIIVFMGHELSYWMFTKDLRSDRKVVGSGYLSCSFCAHCPQISIENIMKAIQEKYLNK